MMDRRQLLRATGGLAGLAALGTAGCGSQSPSGDATLNFWSFYGEPFGAVLTKVFDRYSKANPGVKVNHRVIPFGDFNRTLLQAGSAGKLPDIALISALDTGTFAEAGIVQDITDRVEQWGEVDNYFKGGIDTTLHKGKRYGLPHVSDCYVLWCNTDLVKTPPQTWDELATTAEDLSKGDRYGLTLSAVKGVEGATAWVIRLLSAGGDVTKLDSEAGRTALRQWVDLVKTRGMSREVLTMVEDDAKDRFAAGKAAMMINSASYVNTLRTENPDLKWKVAKIPEDVQSATFLAQENLTITAGAKDPDAAWKLVAYLQKPDVLTKYLPERNKLPAREDLSSREPWSDDPVWQVFLDQLPSAWAPTGKTAQVSAEILTHVQGAIQAAVSGDKTVDAALAQAQQKIDGALEA
ncbi:MAG: ABC transporter substrate-binding protein [Micromonosporaceae bacterium]